MSIIIREFLDEWSDDASHDDIISACDDFLDTASDEDEEPVELEANGRTFYSDVEDDVEFIESVCDEAERRSMNDEVTDMYYVDDNDRVHTMKRAAFCEKFNIEIPFLRFHWLGLSAPEGVATTFDCEDDLRDAMTENPQWTWADDETNE